MVSDSRFWVLDSGLQVHGSDLRSWGLVFRPRVQGSGFRVQDSGFRVQGSGFRVQGSGFRVQGLEFRVQGSGFRVQGSGLGVQGSGLGVQGSRLRIQGSGFRVQGSGFRVPGLEGCLSRAVQLSQVDMPGLRYKSVDFAPTKIPSSPNR